MTLKLIIAPAEEPVDLTSMKVHLRVEHTVDDDLITTLIAAARQEAEHYLQRALITQTWERVLDAFPLASGCWVSSGGEIELGMPTVQSVVSVVYIDTAGVTQTLGSTLYSLDADTLPGWVLPAINTTWPQTLDTADAVRVRFVSGYGLAAAVPASIKAWIKLRVGSLYKARETVVMGDRVTELASTFADSLLDPHRYYGG